MANLLAYGFVTLQDVFARELNSLNSDVVDTAIAQSLAEHNRVVGELLDRLVGTATAARERFRLPGGGTLQPLDEHGIPVPVQVGAYQDIGFPIAGGGTGWGTNRVSRQMMTVGQANELQVMVQSQDRDWVKRHVLAAILDNTEYLFGDYEIGDVTVYPLANGDAQLYMLNTGLAATDNHYLAQAAAIADATNPYPAIRTELSQHPGNTGPYVAFIASSLRSTTEALATFVPVGDPDIELGTGSDRLAAGIDGIRMFGDEVLGKVDGVWIVEYSGMPTDYILALATGAATPAIAMREYPAPGLQGLIEEDFSPDGNRQERRFIRYAGFGARNRVAAVVQRIGNGAYAIPTGYATPLPV